MSRTCVRGPLKWHGGKCRLASRIVRLMPRHVHYVEPYFGGGQVLFAKDPEGVSEVVNDVHAGLINFWRVLQDPQTFDHLRRRLEVTPFAEVEFEEAVARLSDPDPVVRAAAFFVRCRQSLAGRMDAFTGVTATRTRRGMNNETSGWLSAVDGLPAVHERLRRVLILNRPALDVIRQQDGHGTLFYLDPPYLPETRAAADMYAHEMTRADHEELLDLVVGLKGKVLISGYPSGLYEERLVRRAGWVPHTSRQANHAASGDSKRVMEEVVWLKP